MAKIINVVITRQTTPIAEKNFSIASIFSTDTPTDVTFLQGTSRNYTDLDGVSADFSSSTDTYKAVQALMSQENQPSEFRIFLRNDVVAIEKTLTFSSAILTGQTINGTVNGTALTATVYATSDSATLGALATKIENIEGVLSADVVGSVITVVASDEWELSLTGFEVTGTGTKATVTVATTEAGNTQGTDVVTASAENKDWYVMLSTSADKGAILSAAAAIESQGKLFFAMTDDSDTITSATTDVMSLLKAKNYSRTAIFYTHDTSEFFPMALTGRHLTLKPGQVIFSLKTLAGVSVDPDLTSTHETNILAKNGNLYTTELGKDLTKSGRVAGGDFIDTIRDIDYLSSQLTIALFLFIVTANKVGFTNENVIAADGEMKKVLQRMFDEGIIKNDFKTTPPTAESVSVNNRANRILPDLPFVANLQGAIQSISISGTVKV